MKATVVLISLLLLSSAVPADELAVTVYNSNLGVISETRKLEFERGTNELAFRDVPSQIDAASVTFDLIDGGRTVSILEQNYAYDLVSPEQIYSRYIDKQIELIDKEGKIYSGQLLAHNSGAITLRDKTGGIKIVQLGNIMEVNFPNLPEGLITRPTLFWKYNSDYAGELECKVGYQTSGMTWSAEYIGVLSEDETSLHLSGWSSINNTSGKTYTDATLKLVAGDIHRVTDRKKYQPMADAMRLESAAGAGFEEKAFFEYHLYTLPRKATLANKEIKQISLFEPASTTVEKEFMYKPDYNAKDVNVTIKFKNSSETGLGMPLPGGRVRVFKGDDDGSLILLGEDRIEHTPRDEELNIKVGTAFDIVAEERLMQRNQVTKLVEERTFEIELRNHKKTAVTVIVEKKLWGIWEIIDSNYAHTVKDAQTVHFEVPVEADGTSTLTLRVRFTRQ